jgi:alkyl hydroperoxide reductase subunit AhpC
LAELRTLLNPGEKVSLFAISIDDAVTSKAFAEKIAKDGKGVVNFPILSDPMHRTIDSYGVYDPAYAGQRFEDRKSLLRLRGEFHPRGIA